MKTEQIYRVFCVWAGYYSGGEDELGYAQGNLEDIKVYFEEKYGEKLRRAHWYGHKICFQQINPLDITPEGLDKRKKLLERKALLESELSELEERL